MKSHLPGVKKINLIYIISNINKALAFEWIARDLDKNKFNLIFIILNPGKSHLESFIRSQNIKVYFIRYTSTRQLPSIIFKLYKIFKKEKADIIHSHLFAASLAGMIAGKLAGVKRRIYTRHHATSHHIYHPKMVKYDRLINRFATDIIAISLNVEEILFERENVPHEKVHLIHHGFELDSFENPDLEKVILLQKKYNSGHRTPAIGVISRYTHWKGVQFTIPAFAKLLKNYPDAILILANGSGEYTTEIRKLLSELPAGSYVEMAFEEDLFSLYQIFDIFVHVPIDSHSEAFGQTYVEALSAGIPSVFTLSGIAKEFVIDKKNALVVPFQNSERIYESMKMFMEQPDVAKEIGSQGQKDVRKMFTLQKMLNSLTSLYGK